jgi:DNA-binding SARP family transcriptional activator
MIRMIAMIRATTATVALLAGVPVLLVALGGSPLPDHPPSATQVQAWLEDPLLPAYVPGTARVVAWLIWALLAALVFAVGVLRARRWRWERLAAYLPGPVQGLAATLLGAATVTTAVGIPPAQAAAPATIGDIATPSPATTTSGLPGTAGTADRQSHSAAKASPTVTVRRGDTLWDIAADRLGDPHRWKQIYRLNTSRHRGMRGGTHIEPGWTLTLPTSTTVPGHHRPRPDSRTGTVAHPPADGTASSPSCSAAPAPGAAVTSTATPATAVPGTSSPGTPNPTVTAERDTTTTRQPGDPNRGRQPSTGISLPGGSWIDLGLATAITTAVALIWAHRRRRYRRRPPSAKLRLNDPTVAPMPPVVDQIRRRLRRGTADVVAASGTNTAELDPAPTGHAAAHDEFPGFADLNAGGAGPWRDDGRDDQRQRAQDAFAGEDIDERITPTPALAARPAVPSLAHPLAAIWPPAGLGLTGPGADAAARGFLTSALAAGVDQPDERSWVVMPSAVAATLLGAGAGALAGTPRLSVTTGLDEALDLLEAQTLHRSRLVYTHEVDTVAELRAIGHAEEPIPPMMLLADASTRHQRTRIAAVLAQGQRLDVHGVLIGTWPDGDTIEVAADGTTTLADGHSPRHGPHPADIGRLTVLTAAQTSDLLHTLAESHTGQQAPAAIESATSTTRGSHAGTTADEHDAEPATTPTVPTSPAPSSPAATDENRLNDDAGADIDELIPSTSAHPTTDETHPRAVSARPDSGPAWNTNSGSAPVSVSVSVSDGTDEHRAAGQDASDDAADVDTAAGRVEITVLGPSTILGLPTGIAPRKKSLELLVYLAVHDGEATTEAILDDVLGDVPASKAPGRLYTYISDLRTVLRRTAGRGTYLSHPGQRYVLNRDLVDVDLWRMHDAIRDASLATDPPELRATLRRAADTYSGPLADGTDYEWIEPYREAVRRQALDASLALAEALAGTPAEQITVLDAAIRHHPYTEQLYQQAMRTRAELGHLDAIRTLRRALTRALDEIDAEPADETITLADQLVARLQHIGHPEPRRATRPGDGAAA